MTSNRWKKAHTAESIFEMDLIKDALDKEGIEYVVKEHKDTAYDGLFVLQKGYATFFIKEDDQSAAMSMSRISKASPMWHFRRIDPFDFCLERKFISFVGAGGKTSLAEYLADEAGKRGKRVALTTTTKIYAGEPYTTIGKSGAATKGGGSLMRVGKTIEHGKLTGLDEEDILSLGEQYDLVLIEADGAKGHPLKYPTASEPVIPPCSEGTIVLAGLDGIGRAVKDAVFRWELLREASGRLEEIVTPSFVLRLLEKDALMKGVDAPASLLVLNKYDLCSERSEALKLAKAASEATGVTKVIVASVKHGVFYGLDSA